VRVWGVASNEEEATVAAFAAAYGLSFPVLLDLDGAVIDIYGLDAALPTSPYPQEWVIDGDGRVAYVDNEYQPDDVRSVLDALLE